MKIVHLCLCGPYSDGFAYQENELVAQNILDHHEVTVIASTETYGPDRTLIDVEPCEYIGSDGARVIRLAYSKWAPRKVMSKLRVYPKLYSCLIKISPDVILFHGLCSWELETAARFKTEHPATKLYADCHEDFNNSARTLISKYFLHALYYRLIVQRNLKSIDKVLCVSTESMSFASDFYGVPDRQVEFYPLGGKILEDVDYAATRFKTRENYLISEDQIIFLQSGKLDRTKRLVDALKAFVSTQDKNFRYFIVGQLIGEVEPVAMRLIESDPRITFLGWRSPEELRQLLCAADVYVQPFGQSATMQMSLCCRCAVLLQEVPSHHVYFRSNGYLLNEKRTITEAFSYFSENSSAIPLMAEKSAEVAKQYLDYINHARRLCQ